jgi:tetratricopeptide (TPR) repeat protein
MTEAASRRKPSAKRPKMRRILDVFVAPATFLEVARAREATETTPSPEQHLQKAMAARSARMRAKYAKLGLSASRPIDRTTQAMLLRQLYLAHYEGRRFTSALEVAVQLIRLQVLTDVAHQDAARACQAIGDIDRAVGHLRLAARSSPASRRAFHQWTLGGLFYLRGRHSEAASMLQRAARWGTTDKPLYIGHLALAQCAQGERLTNLDRVIDQLETAPCGQGYGRFILGRLCMYARRPANAVRYLEAFVRRTSAGRLALGIALEGELDEAKRCLTELRRN